MVVGVRGVHVACFKGAQESTTEMEEFSLKCRKLRAFFSASTSELVTRSCKFARHREAPGEGLTVCSRSRGRMCMAQGGRTSRLECSQFRFFLARCRVLARCRFFTH